MSELDSTKQSLSIRFEITSLSAPERPIPPPQPAISPRLKRKPYVGLANQGATCYMNSILQTLFHLTKFRDVVYQMPTEDVEDKANSIPLNLQALFHNMQRKLATCITRDLTTSFGWCDGEAFVQHDIQEFLRVLLAKIEEKMSGTDRKDAIAEIFRGKFRHSISNPSLEFEENRFEDFYDISLQVRGLHSLDESLRLFITPEQLSGENCYDTGTELGRIPVSIGVRILELPPVLQLHLKRFEYDLARFSLIKIDDEFTFPQKLDMRPYLHISSTEQQTKYELYAVLVHSGTAFGGHYYVYLRPGGGEQWFQFNDSIVEEVDAQRAIFENFGGRQTRATLSLTSTYSTTKIYSAYMLFYVKEDKIHDIFNEEQLTPVGNHVPIYAEERLQLATSIKRTELRAYTEDSLQKNCQTATLGLTAQGGYIIIDIAPDSTFEQLYAEAAKLLDCSIDTIRLWKFGIGIPLDRPIPKTESQTIASLVEKRIFIQRKPAAEEVLLKAGQIVVFVKCYSRESALPLSFLTSCVVNSEDPVNKILPSLIGSTECTAYREDPGSTIMAIRKFYPFLCWSEQDCVNGTVIVLQPTKPIPSHLTKHHSESDLIPEETTTDGANPLKIISYFSLMVNQIPATFEEYYKVRANTIDLQLVAYNSMISQCVLRLPADTELELLRNFVALAQGTEGDLVIDEEQQELLLFQNRPKKRVPELQPIMKLDTEIDFGFLYFLVADKPFSVGRRQTILVDFSRTSYHRSDRRCFYVELPAEYPKIEEGMTEIIGTSRPVRKLVIRSSTIVQIIHELTTFEPLHDSIRFEYIPEDQIEVKENELVIVTRCKVDRTSFFMPTGFPFFLNIEQGATLDDVKEQIKRVCHESDEAMFHYRFAILKNPVTRFTSFEAAKLLKKDEMVGGVIDPVKQTLAWILPADGSSIGGIRSEAIKIKN
jgi:ubiquitin carboxyl-terminal hydrolase 7